MNIIQGHASRWIVPQSSSRIAEIAAQHTISYPIAQVLLSRGYSESPEIEKFLFTDSSSLAPITELKHAERAVERILSAINTGEKVLISGDYDVDGITASSLMMLCLRPLSQAINFFLPHRTRDGYGLSITTVERAAHNGYSLLITVDNGITAHEPVRRARELNLDVIITDHHTPLGGVPDAYAVVNPHQEGCAYPFKYFAGVGVVFKLMSLLYERLNKPLPEKAYELLLLGTVADVVPLKGENRYWVRYGLARVNKNRSYALNKLCTQAKITKDSLTSLDIGFGVAPQINALGRLDDPRDGVQFLIGTDTTIIDTVGEHLLRCNIARKDIERTVLQDIIAQINSGVLDITQRRVIVAAGSHWPPGVIGLVASRLVGIYNRPVIIMHVGSDGIAKGSGRSLGKFNLFQALSHCATLLEKFGGHAHAAGLSIESAKIPKFIEMIDAYAHTILTTDDLISTLTLDAQLSLPEITAHFMRDMRHLEPFGAENKQPVFYISNGTIIKTPQLLKEQHVKAALFDQGVIKPILFFNKPELYPILCDLVSSQQNISVAAHVVENHWNGSVSTELQGLDICVAQ